MSKMDVEFEARKDRAVVNGEEWTTGKNATGLYAMKRLTECTSMTLKFLPWGATTAIGGLVYVSRCPERECANVADYKGTFTAR